MWPACLTHRIPKSVLFGWMSHPRPQGGPRRRWRDVVQKDLKEVKIGKEEWYDKARKVQSRMAGTGYVQAGDRGDHGDSAVEKADGSSAGSSV